MALADKLFSEMLQMGLVPDRAVYNALIHGYAEQGDTQKALSLHSEMVNQKINVDKMTYNSLILGHFKQGKISEVKGLVDDMKAQGLAPKADTYNLLVKGHCELKDFSGAYFWYREMFENGFLLNVSTCNELTDGLEMEGRLREARIVCSEMSVKGTNDCSSIEDVVSVAKV